MMDEILRKMKELEPITDYEVSHHAADQLLCDALEMLGYTELVDAFHDVGKWYA